MKLIRSRRCPYCTSIQNFRQHRQLWMRRIPGSRLYECQYCSSKYVSVYRIFSFGVVKGKDFALKGLRSRLHKRA